MGFRFDIQQANIVAYLTTLNRKSPRISYGNFYAFLSVLSVDPQHLFTSSAEARVIGRQEWIEVVKRVATRTLTHVEALHLGWSDRLPDDVVTTELPAFRDLFGDFNLFGLAVGSWADDEPLRVFTTYAAISSGKNALFLVPMGWRASDPVQLLDPFPAVALVAERSSDWPGIAFWSRGGIAAFAPLREAEDVPPRC